MARAQPPRGGTISWNVELNCQEQSCLRLIGFSTLNALFFLKKLRSSLDIFRFLYIRVNSEEILDGFKSPAWAAACLYLTSCCLAIPSSTMVDSTLHQNHLILQMIKHTFSPFSQLILTKQMEFEARQRDTALS